MGAADQALVGSAHYFTFLTLNKKFDVRKVGMLHYRELL